MATSAQGAVITWNGVAMNEVTEYSLDMSPGNVRPGNVGTLEVKAFANNAIVPDEYSRMRRVIITQGASTVAKLWALVESVKVDALRNDVLRYTFSFRIAWVSRT